MKTSTMKDNFRASNKTNGVIILYCGPYEDEALLKFYGMNILQLTGFIPDMDYIDYKPDYMTI